MSFVDNKSSFDVDVTTSPDDSLLVSPTAAAANSRSQRLGDIDDSMDNGNLKSNIGGMVHINNYYNQTSDQQRDDNNFLLEDSMLDESFQTLSGGGGETTPMRSKFRTSCFSAMEELDFLAPTPCKSSTTNMDEKSSSKSEENNKKECGVGIMESSPVDEEKKQLFTLPEEEDSKLFGVDEPAKVSTELQVNTTNNNNTSNNILGKDAASAFRHPCIRQSSNESISLELEMAHPVNSNNNSSSFDSSNREDYYYESTHFNNDAAKTSVVNDIDLSMEVEKGASIKSKKEVLVEENRINNIGMSTAVQTREGKEEAAMEDPAKQLGALKEEEEGNESHPENWGELDEEDANDDQDDSLYDQSINDTYDPNQHQQQADEQHVDNDDLEDSTPGNGDDGAALGYLDSDSSDDDSDTEINKDYVDTMRDSISSYFSSRSDSSQIENGNNSLGDLATYKNDVNEEDQNDVGEACSYATNGIQSVQYQRYENVLVELKQKGIGSNNNTEENQSNNNNLNESQDLLVDGNVHKNDCINSKPAVKSKYFPETTFEETRPLQNDQFTFASSDIMVDDSFIQKHAPHTLLGNNSKQSAAETLCDLANQSTVDGIDEINNHAAKVNEEKFHFQSTSCEQQVGRRDLHWNDEMEDMLELKQSNPFDYDDDSVDAEQEVEARGEKETTLQSTVHESTSIDSRRWSKESALPSNIDNSSLSPICGDGSSPHNCELGSSDLSADSDNSLSNSSDMADLKTEKSSIFQVLSQQPIQKQPSKEVDEQEIPYQSLQGNTKQPDSNNESIDTQEVEQSIVHQEQQSDTPAPVNKKTLEDSRQSLEDLSSYEQTFSSTSSAFLESLKGAAEIRKREVSRVRQSMERKEQILYEERISPSSMEAVEEEEETIINHSNRLNASSTSSLTSDCASKPRASNSSLSAPRHKSSASDENPFIPFMAEPEVPDPRYSAAIGSKRKSSNAFKPHPTQNKSSVKSSTSNTKPTKRLLSSQDSKSSQEKRSSSTFKARPLPASTFIKPLLRDQGKSIRSGKENGTAFVPSSEMRAQERSIYDANKKQREQQQRQDQLERRNQVIQQTRSEIRELKEKLR